MGAHRRVRGSNVRSALAHRLRARCAPARRHGKGLQAIGFGLLLALTAALAVPAATRPAYAADGGQQAVFLDEDFMDSALNSEDSWTWMGDSIGLTAADRGDAHYVSSQTSTSGYIGSRHGEGYLQLTDASKGQTGTILYNVPVPTEYGLDISFYQWQFGSTSYDADGIGFFLAAGNFTLDENTQGPVGQGYGGALGYSAIQAVSGDDENVNNGTKSGLANGILGIGLDVFGNYSTNDEVGGDPRGDENRESHAYSVTVRGAGEQDERGVWTQGYGILERTRLKSNGWWGQGDRSDWLLTGAPEQSRGGQNAASEDDENATLVHIVISPKAADGSQTITVTLEHDGETYTAIDGYVLSGENALPDTVKFGFSASTGEGTDAHFIRGLTISSVDPVDSAITLVKQINGDKAAGKTVFEAGDTVPYMFTVTNTGGTTLTGVSVNDPDFGENQPKTAAGEASVDLEPGETAVFYGELTLTAGLIDGKTSYTNTATATGTPEDGGDAVTDIDDETVKTVVPAEPLGDPEHSKKIRDNGDGTYTLALDVTGRSESTSTSTVEPTDIVLVLDTSGSMNLGFGAVYSGELDQDETYIINTGTNSSQEVTYSTRNRSWGYSSGLLGRWHSVTPKSSENSSGTQFYEMTRLDALKDAATTFVDNAAETNSKIEDASDKIHISLVTYATSSNVRADLQLCDEDAANQINGVIDRLDASGSTSSGNALDDALDQVKENGRDDADTMIVFFTDGVPSGSGSSSFSSNEANEAVDCAHTLKQDYDATIYSIGIFDGADPSVANGTNSSGETTKANTFMNAVSSNYPEATKWSTLGEGGDAGYYKVADDAEGLASVFDQIFNTITSTSDYSNVIIYDELSKYAQAVGIKTEGDADSEGFKRVASGVKVIVTDPANPDADQDLGENEPTVYFKEADGSSHGTVKVVFPESYKLQDGWTYTVQFNVEPTDAAFNEYGQDGYEYEGYPVEGDAGTDMAGNSTSSGKPGFYTNDEAYVSYVTAGSSGTAEYDKPVLQVGETLQIEGVLQVTKTLNGHALDAQMFEFTVTPVASDTASAEEAAAFARMDAGGITYSNDASAAQGEEEAVRTGNALTVTRGNVGKTYAYEYAEASSLHEGYTGVSADDVTFDQARYRVELTVSEVDGAPQVSMQKKLLVGDTWQDEGDAVVITQENASPDEPLMSIDFVNSYKPLALAVTKTDMDGNERPGAKFDLYLESGDDPEAYDENDTHAQVYTSAAMTDLIPEGGVEVDASTSTAAFYGLQAGATYWIVETKVPAGYQMSDPYKLEIAQDGTAVLYKPMGDAYEKVGEITPDDGDSARLLKVTFRDQAIGTLPESGGSGSIVVPAAGVALVAVAGWYLLRRLKPRR